MAACLVLSRAEGASAARWCLAGILLARFGSRGVVVIWRCLIVRRRESARDWVRSAREFLGLMVRAGAVVDKIGVVSAYFGEGFGRVMILFGDV
jgi:hypothetical protein